MYQNAGNVIATGVIVGAGRSSLHGGTHAVAVVFANENDGQFPQFGHVESLEQLALVGRTVTVQRQTHAISTYITSAIIK